MWGIKEKYSNYPPAKPGALKWEPLKAVVLVKIESVI